MPTFSDEIALNKLNRRELLIGGCVSLASITAFGSEVTAAEKEVQQQRLSSGRSMSYRVLGQGDTKIVLIHGFPGSSLQFCVFDQILSELGICAVAPDLYGKSTDWQKRSSVMDAGRDIAELSRIVHDKSSLSAVVCVSAGVKDGIATTVAYNSVKGGDKVELLLPVSGQGDLSRRDVFSLLDDNRQFEFNCLRGVSKSARLRVFQPIRNLGARIKQNVAEKRIATLCDNPNSAFERVIGQMSMSSDWPILHEDPSFKKAIYQEIANYSSAEILDSFNRLYNWNIDLRGLKGTQVTIVHGTADCMVPVKNAYILQSQLKEAGISSEVKTFPDGHLLLKKRAAELAKLVK